MVFVQAQLKKPYYNLGFLLYYANTEYTGANM